MKTYNVIIIGAGLSGLSAAVELVDQKKSILVLEGRDVPGGRTSSWTEKGMQVESGLHRFLGFYKYLPGLLEHVGIDVNKMLCWEDEIEIRMPDGKGDAVFAASPLHKPLKSLTTLLFNNDFISPIDKAKLGVFFSDGFIQQRTNPDDLDKQSVYQFAKKHNLDNDTITKVLVPLTEGLFFLSVKEYNALNFFALFSPYLKRIHKTRIGAFEGGMTDVMINPIIEYIKKKGADVKMNAPVEELIIEKENVVGVIVDGKKIMADHVILAASLKPAQEILQKKFKNHKWFKPMLSLETMPSVTFQIELTEPSMELDRTTFSPETVFSAYAEQSRTTFKKTKGRISIILAEPERQLKLTDKQILAEVLKDAKRIGINLNQNTVKDFRKISWPHDFYSYTKGMIQKRPTQKTPIKGLSLAGDYTKQKFLQTMEGAAVSGQLAAKNYLKQIDKN